MDILRNIVGSLTSGVIRLLVTVGILAAAYFFILKPVLKTTDDAIKSSGIDEIGKTIKGFSHGLQHEIRHSFKATKQSGVNPQRLIHCIQHAHGDVHRIQRCTRRF